MPSSSESPLPPTVDRLVGLCRLWGEIGLLHPSLSAGEVDWDQALLETIPMVLASRSDAEYRAAIEHLLALLRDPWTRLLDLEPGLPPRSEESTAAEPALRWEREQVAVVVARDFRHLHLDDDLGDRVRSLMAEAASADAIILDLRKASPAFVSVLSDCLSALLGRDVHLPAFQIRFHSGHAPDAGGTSGGYFSGMLVRHTEIIRGTSPNSSIKPLAVIIDRSSDAWDIAVGLQTAGLATLVFDGDIRKAFWVRTIELAGDVRVGVRDYEIVNPDGTLGLVPDIVVEEKDDPFQAVKAALEALLGPRISPAERRRAPTVPPRITHVYETTGFPSLELRLLGLFRMWNVIDRFFAYHHLTDRPWDEVLRESIPKVIAAADDLEYSSTRRTRSGGTCVPRWASSALLLRKQ